MRLLRNLSRRKLRTSLTILGITIGIWALVVFSSMANKINALVEGGSEYYADKLIVSDASAGGNFSTTPMSIDTADRIAAVEGVAAALPQISMFLSDEPMGASMGMPDTIVAGEPEADAGLEDFALHYAQGRPLTNADNGSSVAVVGADLSRKFGVGAGDTLAIRGHDFEVVGVLEPTLTAPDTSVLMPLAAGQQLFAESLPEVMRQNVDVATLATQIVVYPEAGVDPVALSERVEAEVANTSAMTGAEFDDLVGSSIAIFNAIIIGVAAISLIVGGLSVINTMAMSVQERTREIGIKRAIGGSRGRVVRELVSEAGMIGFLGGAIGVALGALVVFASNEAGRASGTVLFDLTPGTALFALGFSTILGMLAGIIPAWSAARLDPVQALRYE
ncbi:MAG TPA: ABC transporter permease [Candidatus Limnocylindria bacterium]|nr:ABC transporter permease [Candidatus Limnocylindria bacterium]